MNSNIVTILDVLDNFLSNQTTVDRDLQRISGKALFQLGEEVRRFVNNYEITPPDQEGTHPVFLGGWPSANVWDSPNGSLAMTSLLYSGQLLAKDPIADWFSFEQYAIPSKLAARPGFIEAETRQLNTQKTRRFLQLIVPQLFRLRPLIKKGIIVLLPSKRFIKQRFTDINEAARQLTTKISGDIAQFTRQFKPGDLTMEDNMRGVIPFAGGNREEQIRKAIEHSARYFTSEYALATEHGFIYTAPFKYETFLCQQGFNDSLAPIGARVLNAVFSSQLKLFQGLTPDIVAQVRDDDNFGIFRSNLFQIYKDIPSGVSQKELDQYIAETEAAMIEPYLRDIEKETQRGILGKVGLELKQAYVRMGVCFLAGLAVSHGQDPKTVLTNSGVGALAAFAAGLVKKKTTGPQVVWKRLYEHGLTVADEVPHTQVSQGNILSEGEFWGIPDKPTLNVYMTAGELIADFIPEKEDASENGKFNGSAQNPYGLCSCRSGQKYKFCCCGIAAIRYSSIENA